MSDHSAATQSSVALSSTFPLVLGGNVFGWTADRDATFEVLDRFMAEGGTHIDTSDSYMAAIPGLHGGESETLIGQWMASRQSRGDVFLATKVGSLMPYTGLSRRSITAAVDDSLRRLQTDYIDLYWAHRDDETVSQEETARAFDSLVLAGKVRHLGASNFSGARVTSLIETARALGCSAIEAVQPEYNLMEREGFETDQEPSLKRFGLQAWTYHSLAAGFLTGKYRNGQHSDQAVRADRARAYAGPRGDRVLDAATTISERDPDRTIAAVALAWLAAQPSVMAPIASARSLEQLTALLPVKKIILDADELDLLNRASTHRIASTQQDEHEI